MIAFIVGDIVQVEDDGVIVDNGGFGIKVNTSLSTIRHIKPGMKSVMFHTYLAVREDDLSLYGFISKEELSLYRLLISVSKVGPKLGIAILSAMSVDEISKAIVMKDVKALSKISGIGTKTAERLILELKDKIKADISISELPEVSIESETFDMVVSALTDLGYTRAEVDKVLRKINTEDKSLEAIIKEALVSIARG